jgi:hypothetical protein
MKKKKKKKKKKEKEKSPGVQRVCVWGFPIYFFFLRVYLIMNNSEVAMEIGIIEKLNFYPEDEEKAMKSIMGKSWKKENIRYTILILSMKQHKVSLTPTVFM